MMYPILCKVKYETLHHVFRERAVWVQIGFSIVLNWLVAPLLMVSSMSMSKARLTMNSSVWHGRFFQMSLVFEKD